MAIDELDVAVRTWAVSDRRRVLDRHQRKEPSADLGPSEWSLTFDTETRTDASQRLRFGTYQVRRGSFLKHAGVFYDPEVLTPSELVTLRGHADTRGWRVYTRDEFVHRVFFPYAYRAAGLVVCFNAPFDISRLAIDHGPAKSPGGVMRGGFSFRLSEDRRNPSIQVKKIGSRASFIRFAVPKGRSAPARNRASGGSQGHFRGYFVDVATLAGALLSHKGTLEDLAGMLQTPTRKHAVTHGEELTPEYLDYAMADPQVTWECFDTLRQRYNAYGVTSTPIWQVYSEASVGKAHLRAMNLRPWREVQPDFPDWVIAVMMETYYGGRTEGRIRRVPVTGLLLDFVSEYPTSFVLQGLWSFLRAERIEWREEGPERVQALLETGSIETALDRSVWNTELHALVLVAPDGDRLPTRARYGGPESPWSVAVPFRTGGPSQWWTLADCFASKLMTGQAPRVIRVLRFEAGPAQSDLRPVRVAGNPEFLVDPYTHDPIKRLVELRASVKDRIAVDGDPSGELDGIQQGMKIAANAIAYGIGIEINVTEHKQRAWATVYRSDGTRYRNRYDRTESVGSHFHPLIATLVAAGGRLLLATAMALAERAGGTYAFCDTDSLFIPATKTGPDPLGEQFPHLSFEAVSAQIVRPFAALNPYDLAALTGSILKIEPVNYDPLAGRLRALVAWIIASKRYRLRSTGPEPRLVFRSRHGLGHLLPPTSDGGNWLDDWWDEIDACELDPERNGPSWRDRPLVGRHPITSRREELAFASYNAGRRYQDRVRPYSFLMSFHRHRLVRGAGSSLLVAPFERDPERWSGTVVIDRSSGASLRVQVSDPHVVLDGSIPVQSYGDYHDEYRTHPESKLADATGRPCAPWTRGVLHARNVEAVAIARLGKESTRLVGGEPTDERPLQYREPGRCGECGRALLDLRARYCSAACKQRAYRKRKAPARIGRRG